MSLNGNLNKSQFMEELQQKVEHINDVLEKFLPAEEGQQRIIFEAMNYSVRAGGKRLRPILMEETYHMFGGSSAVIEPFMAAIEMIHTYSLVHDDLPAMDNDEYRRGKKTTHAVYGEAMGILAGDALLNWHMRPQQRLLTWKWPMRVWQEHLQCLQKGRRVWYGRRTGG